MAITQQDTKQDRLDTFCRLALESDLSDAQLTAYAQIVCHDEAADMVAAFRSMSATEFAERVKRACNGNATSTSNEYTRIHRETRLAATV